MIPAAFPGFPVTVFPGLIATQGIFTGLSGVDITAAVAVLAWIFGGLVALRIAIVLSHKAERSPHPSSTAAPTGSREGFRDAA